MLAAHADWILHSDKNKNVQFDTQDQERYERFPFAYIEVSMYYAIGSTNPTHNIPCVAIIPFKSRSRKDKDVLKQFLNLI